MNNPSHTSVKTVESTGWVEEGWVEKGWVGNELVVSFTETAERELGFSSKSVSNLARRVVEFWRNELNNEAI